jgi:hypothetical protein
MNLTMPQPATTSSKSSSQSSTKSSTKSSSTPVPAVSGRPGCNSQTDKTIHLFERDAAISAVKAYCSQLASKKVVLNSTLTYPPVLTNAIKAGIAQDKKNLTFDVHWYKGACNSAPAPINFAEMTPSKCLANFQEPIDACKSSWLFDPFSTHASTNTILSRCLKSLHGSANSLQALSSHNRRPRIQTLSSLIVHLQHPLQ